MIDSRRVKELAFEAGFDLCGITTAQVIPEARERFYEWLRRGYHATLQYLARDPERRSDPTRLLEGAKSIIMLGLNYFQVDSNEVPAGFGRVSKYARGRDYHKIIAKRQHQLVELLQQNAGEPAPNLRSYVDHGPILERAYAEKAGLGFIGRNGLLITRQFGSWVFLSAVLTDLEFEADDQYAINHGRCGSCHRCIDACPTGAIVQDKVVDAGKCISYLTIERPPSIRDELAAKMGDMIFGCDICQSVCPHNGRAVLTRHEELKAEAGVGEFVDSRRILSMQSREEFLKLTAGTPLTRPKLDGLQRNAQIVLANQRRVGQAGQQTT
ncbi:MAG TPA: tRNA epoxyqueuosine(34) reductase QueG [Candidatus Acidoferrum sp.]|nr:tRNA epoxyqueuosine(34) reductase QueG [Candidatus Acidoferrum sp.]